MRLGQHAHQPRRRHHQPDLPAGQREDLAGRRDLDGALAHAGPRQHRDMAAAVEDDMLPDLVADRDGVMPDAEMRRAGRDRPR